MTKDFAAFKEKLYLISLDLRDKYYERAVDKINDLIQVYPDRAEPHFELGKLAYDSWNNADAEKHYKKALEIDPNYFPSYTQLALVLIKEKRYLEAEDLLMRSQRLRNKEESDIHFYLGLMHQNQGNLDEAIEAYTQSLYYSINETQIDSAMKFIRVCKELRGWE